MKVFTDVKTGSRSGSVFHSAVSRMSISRKLIGTVIFTVLFTGIIIALSGYFMLSGPLNEQAKKDVVNASRVVEWHQNLLKNKVVMAASLVANNSSVAMAVKERKGEFLQQFAKNVLKNEKGMLITIADKSGNVVARGHSDQKGDSVINQINVKKALSGEVSTGIEAGSVVKLSLRAGYPVKVGDEIVGSITTGINLSSDNTFVDGIKEELGTECTIFQNDTAVSTTVMKDNKRLIGTKMDDRAVIDTVLAKGLPFVNVGTIMGKSYDTIYWPLTGIDGKTIGMLFIGKDRDYVKKGFTGIIVSLLISILITGALMITIGIVMTRSIVRPIKTVVEVFKGVTAGDLMKKVAIESHDEIGELGKYLNDSVDSLHRIIVKVTESSNGVSSTAGILDSAATEMATSIEQAASQISSVATASEEMSATSSQIAQNCVKAARNSEGADAAATTGTKVIDETINVMGHINERVKKAAAIVKDLGKRSDQIGEVIELINEIADQTNLLALNAAIEAARAGEHGRGFAVVADEVRKLAERTSQATKEIGHTIQSIQSETGNAVATMEEGVAEVERGAENAGRSGETLKDILHQVSTVTAEINEIAVASEQQTSTTDEIARNIHDVSRVMQDMSQRIQNNTLAYSRLTDLSKELQRLVGQFRV
jgi:methyl-accepting chemotaxis protein